MIAKTTILFSVLMALAFVGCGDSPPDSSQPSSPDQTEAIADHHHDVAGETCFICNETKREPGIRELDLNYHSRQRRHVDSQQP